MTNSEHPSDESAETSNESTETSDSEEQARRAVAEDERLQQVGDSIDEAKQAAADVDLPDRDDTDAAGS